MGILQDFANKGARIRYRLSVEGTLRMEALLKGLLNYLEITERDSDRLLPIDCNHVLSRRCYRSTRQFNKRRYGDL